MTHEGKLKQEFNYEKSEDEIGELSTSFNTLFQQLNHYTGYLESMASKLSHELGTPLSIIKSSLENMQLQGVSDNNQVFLNRGIDASQRLGLMLARMGEASKLEQALQNSKKEHLFINEFLTQYVEAIKLANPGLNFSIMLPEDLITGLVSPELIAQLLDKLMNNAISFHIDNSEIIIKLSKNIKNSEFAIDIFNQGQWIPEKIQNSLFDSMVSIRNKDINKVTQESSSKKYLLPEIKTNEKSEKNIFVSQEVHLGLGLHIAHLITLYHQGQLTYINRDKDSINWPNNGVSFVLKLPLINDTKSKAIIDNL